MAGSSLPIVALAVIGGGIVIYYGTRSVSTAFASPASSSGAVSPSGSPATTTTSSPAPAEVSAGVTQIAGEHGWDASEITAWLAVIADEDASGSLTATNPSSGAYGIAQFIDGSGEYSTYGGSADTLIGQLTAMANYIEQRYGTPSAALAHENALHWY